MLCGGPDRNTNYGAKEAGCASLNDLRVDQQATTSGLDLESLWTTSPTYSYDKGKGSTCSIKLDAYGTTYVDSIRLWATAALMAVFSSDIRWSRILESIRLKDRVCLWQNADAQWDELVTSGWSARWTMTHARPMNWGKGHFDASGMPIFDEPMGDDPRKRIERGGVGTKELLLRPQPQDPVYATDNLTWVRGTEANGINQFELGEPGVRATSAGPQFSDHTESPLGGGLGSPPEPKQKILRG